jgi:hypothetical protein
MTHPPTHPDPARAEALEALKAQALPRALSALSEGKHARACEALAPLADLTLTDAEVARAWALMLGGVDDARHLTHELKRLASRWAADPEVVPTLAHAALAWSRRHLRLAPPAADDSPPAIGARALTHCLKESPPSAPEARAALYHARAKLLAFAGEEGEDQALSDLEVSLTLAPSGEAWYTLGRLHLSAARWEKAALCAEQARGAGLEAEQVSWLEAIARTALGAPHLDLALAAWARLKHDDLQRGAGGRPARLGLERVLVSLHAHLPAPHAGAEGGAGWVTEVVWVQPLSPCHGRVLHPTLHALPADVGDLVLWDAQPIDFEDVEGDTRPVMRALACLERGEMECRPAPLPWMPPEAREGLNARLPDGAFFYQGASAEALGGRPHGKLCWRRGGVSGEAAWAALQVAISEGLGGPLT